MRTTFSFFLLISLAGAALAADPDQVLVLCNADYRIDQDGSEPGQDSKELAEYYVRRHTDPVSGKRPWMLGLSCVHGKDHLNQFRLPEDSHDNCFGVEYLGAGELPKDGPAIDSRLVDVTLSKDEAAKLDPKSVVIAVGRKAERADATVIFANGEPAKGIPLDGTTQGDPTVITAANPDGTLGYRFSPRQVEPGVVHVWFDANDKDGKPLKTIQLVCHDFNDFIESTTGRDRIRDDKNYIDDVERQVQDFLENNAAADGTPLREHVLCIVVCHGLPKAVESMFGIARGATGSLGDMGDGSSLEMRLATLYYDVTQVDYMFNPGPAGMLQVPLAHGVKPRFAKLARPLNRDGNGLQRAMITNSLSVGLVGQFNPYQHPAVFHPAGNNEVPGMLDQQKYADPANRLLPPLDRNPAQMQPRLSTDLRKTWPGPSFMYWAMRVDGPTPEIAKAQIDGAVYGTLYLTPKMGTCYNRLAGPPPIQPSVRAGIDELKELGFTLQEKLNDPPKVIGRPLIVSAYFADGPRYLDEGEIAGQDGVLPGGIVYAIKSANGWKQNDDQFGTYFQKMVEAGATVTAGLGAVGGAHITSASWWDDRVLFHHLFRGYDLGECLLMSTYYIDWVTGYVGDPLYRPNVLTNKPDTTPPAVDDQGVHAEILPAKDSYCAILRCTLTQTPQNPEMAEMAVAWRTGGRDDGKTGGGEDAGTRGREDARTGGGEDGKTGGGGLSESASESPALGGRGRSSESSSELPARVNESPALARTWRFSARPWAIMRNLQPGTQYDYTVTLTDAYGNETKANGTLKTPAGTPSKLRHEETLADGKKATPIMIAKDWKPDSPPAIVADAGEIEIEFTALKDKFRIVELSGLSWTSDRFAIGGGTALTHEPLKFDVGKRYRLAARWRRRPLTREVYLIEPDGTERLAACNHSVPWKTDAAVSGQTRCGDGGGEITIHSIRISDAANPAPDEHRKPYVKRFGESGK